MQKKLIVAGQLVIPFYLQVQDSCTESALVQANSTLNSKNLALIDGNIHTWDGKEMPLLARRCRVEWFEIVPEDEVI